MSPKNSLLAAGLTALGLLVDAPRCVAEPPAPPPSGPPASAAPSPSHAVLLLTNQKVIEGLVSEDATSYVVHFKGGKIPYPKRQVEKVFSSMEEVYRYKVAQLADRDPDEHLKLARWCLTNRRPVEAKEQLEAVLALSPHHPLALAMVDKINGAEDRAAIRDPAVVRSSVEVVENAPEGVDPAILVRASRQLGISGLPQIPGLPTPLAVKRAGEFKQFVHPLLQFHCIRCHNERYAGEFRMVSVRTRREASPDALRANLDAALRLIDWDDLSKSEILSSTLRPHGLGSSRRPIFVGSNDRSYQVLAAWVNSLRPPRSPLEPSTNRFASQDGGPVSGSEGFASQRASGVPLPLTPTPASDGRPQPPAAPDPRTPLPSGQFLPGTGAGMRAYAPPDTAFPVPYMLGGPKPKVDPAAGRASAPNVPPPQPAANPGAALPPLPEAEATADNAAPKAKRKPVKFDPALLERALMNRYTP